MKSKLYTKNLMTESLIDLRICDDNKTELHHHEFFELVYVVEGSAEHTIDGHSMIIYKGDYFLINLRSSHGYNAIKDNFKIINCLFVPEFIDRTLRGARSFAEIMNNYPSKTEYITYSDAAIGQVFHDSDGFVYTLLMKMLMEFEEKRRGRLDIIKSLLISLLVSFDRAEESVQEKSIAARIKEYVSESFASDASLSEIAGRLGISLTYASLAFKRTPNMGFRDYLKKFRIEKACDLIRVSDKTLAEISELVGYCDPAFFYKSFKSYVGSSPGEYRKRRTAVRQSQ
jgi:AraC-like DNA-binding protein